MSQQPSVLTKILPEDLLRVMQLKEVSDAAILSSDRVAVAIGNTGDKMANAMTDSAHELSLQFSKSMENAGKWVFLGCLCLSSAYIVGAYLDYKKNRS